MTAPGIVPTPNRAAETPAVAGHARRWAVVALIIVAAIVPLVWAPVARLTAPSDGTMTYPSSPPWTANGAVIVEVVGQPGDLRAGDRVIAVDGVALEIWAGARPDRSFRVGDRVQYQITRSGAGAGEQVLDIDVKGVREACKVFSADAFSFFRTLDGAEWNFRRAG